MFDEEELAPALLRYEDVYIYPAMRSITAQHVLLALLLVPAATTAQNLNGVLRNLHGDGDS